MTEGLEDLPLFSQSRSYTAQAEPSRGRLAAGSSLSAAIQAWKEALQEEGKSPNTIKAFSSDLRLLSRFLGGGTDVAAVGTHDLKNFLDWMLNHRDAPCSPKTYARRVTSIKSFFRWLTERGIVRDDPAEPVPQQTVLSPLPVVLSPVEVSAVLKAASGYRRGDDPDARPYTLVALLLETAIKKGECRRIHLNHIDLESPEGPILFVRYGDVSKRYKERKIPLSEEWVSAFREYLEQYEPQDTLFPWSPRRLEYLLEEIGEAAGLDDEKHLSFDMCRWSSALGDYMAGVEKDKIRQKLGISKIQWREVGKKLDRLEEKVQAGTL